MQNFSKKEELLGKLQLFTNKQKKGEGLRWADQYTAIVINMFKKNQNIQDYIGESIWIEGMQEMGVLKSSFGTTGKIKVEFSVALQEQVPDIKGKCFLMKTRKILKLFENK